MSSLWPGYWKGKKLLDPILFEIPKRNINELLKAKPKVKVKTVGGDMYVYDQEKVNMRYANGVVSIEDFGAGETFFWAFPLDSEVHIILKGKAELTYSLEGTNHTEEKKMIVEEGDVYIIPRGARMTWKVDSGGPLRKMCVLMPGLAVSERRAEALEELS